jgi:hypothetical protein
MKITVLGRGNAGVLTALHYSRYTRYLNNPVEVELIHDNEISPVPVGQATNLTVPILMWDTIGTSFTNLKDFSFTEKTGIMFENWGKKNKEIWHPFPIGTFAFHFEPKEFQDYVINSLKEVKIKNQNIPNYDKIDSDYIFDCRGTPKDFSNYHELINPLNHVLLSKLPPEKDYVKWTRTIATPDGWCFYIPLKDKISLGYNFNNKITSIEKAKENFKKYLGVEEIHNHFPYKQYVAKEPIIDNRVILNGNRLFFLEPLEATAVCSYIKWNQIIWDWIINNKKTPSEARAWLSNFVFQVQSFILYHYKDGSIYNTKFWKESKKLYKKNNDLKLDEIVNYVKDKDYDYIRNIHDFEYHAKEYGTWQAWNIKLWVDNV